MPYSSYTPTTKGVGGNISNSVMREATSLFPEKESDRTRIYREQLAIHGRDLVGDALAPHTARPSLLSSGPLTEPIWRKHEGGYAQNPAYQALAQNLIEHGSDATFWRNMSDLSRRGVLSHLEAQSVLARLLHRHPNQTIAIRMAAAAEPQIFGWNAEQAEVFYTCGTADQLTLPAGIPRLVIGEDGLPTMTRDVAA